VQDNCIVAEKGLMKISDDGNFLEFNLENGCRYQEKGNLMDSATEYTRLSFKNFKKLFDLSVLQKQQTNDSVFKNNFKMLSAQQLSKNVDSLNVIADAIEKDFNKKINKQLIYSQVPKNIWKQAEKTAIKINYNQLIPDSAKMMVKHNAINKANAIKSSMIQNQIEMESREKEIILHNIEWHRKFSLSLACLVLFFIGAPLGSIIRKGGMGMPLVAAIVFFLIFHLLNMFGEKFVKESIASPFVGMWLAVIVLIPVGTFLTYKAMHDSQLFNKEYYLRLARSFKSIWKKNPATKTI
jgi:lipopolysaccharide export system permease protein